MHNVWREASVIVLSISVPFSSCFCTSRGCSPDLAFKETNSFASPILGRRQARFEGQRILLFRAGIEGDTAKARAAYEEFLKLCKDADPDIPLVKQAKAEYTKLR